MKDYIVRATAANAQIRAFAASTTELVEEARTRHNTSPVATAALGRLLTAGAMMGSMMKNPTDVLTLQVQCGGPIGGMTVTADSKGEVKGYVHNPDVMLPPKNGKLDVGGALGPGFLNVIKDMGLKEPYSGQTILQTGEIAEDLTYYFATSEQVPSSVGLGVLMEKGHTPEEMLNHVLEGLDVEITDTLPAKFDCNCSKERIEKAIISVGKKEIQEMIDDGKDIEVKCHFCNTAYTFSVDELKELLKKSR